DARDDDVAEPGALDHDAHGLGDAPGLVGVHGVGLAGLDVAEPARAGAGVAQDHDGRDAAGPALAHVGAVGLFADGVERVLLEEVAELGVLGPAGHFRADPLGLALGGDVLHGALSAGVVQH